MVPLMLACLLAVGCDGRERAGPTRGALHRYADAMALAPTDPEASQVACLQVGHPRLEQDCLVVAIEALASAGSRHDTDALLTACKALADPKVREECAFQVAEGRGSPEACGHAGRYEEDCRMHLLSDGFAKWVPRRPDPADEDLHRRLEEEMNQAGFDADDLRGWSAWFRWVLGSMRPLDRGACGEIAHETRREACTMTALALYRDRLNNLQDRGLLPCGGEEPPAMLQQAGDPELRAMLEERVQESCP